MRSILFLSFAMLVGCTSAGPLIDMPAREEPKAQQALSDLYEKGKSERIQGLPKECIKTFGKIIDLRKTIKDSLFAYSLYQSGLCYEMTNEFDKAIAVYQDALRVRAVVNSELALLEIPSRLAIAYERVGNPDVANKYYADAKKYIENLKKAGIRSNKEYYAETLFQMGTIVNPYKPLQDENNIQLSSLDFESYLKSVNYAQEYLLIVLELNVQPYSDLALNQIVNNFQSSFDFIKNLPLQNLEDSLAAARDRQNKQKSMSASLAHHIDVFETLAAVEKKSKRGDYADIFAKLKEVKSGLDIIINERPVGEGLTPEAQKLQNPKIEGNFVPVKGEKE